MESGDCAWACERVRDQIDENLHSRAPQNPPSTLRSERLTTELAYFFWTPGF
jgi:hypothetical protein